MPELPEVETVRRTLAPIVGAEILRTWWSGHPLRLKSPVDILALQDNCNGAQVVAIRRLGKYLLIDIANRPYSIMVHLGMSGRLRNFPAKSEQPSHTHVEWEFRDGRILRYSDPRRFGQVCLVEFGAESEHPALGALGPDPIVEGLDPEVFRSLCQRTRRPIKVALLDQHLVAGVGNIYASEALWLARIHPKTPANRLSLIRCKRLCIAVVEVLQRALGNGGTSLKDFVSADGHAGQHAHYLWVYDQEGNSCPNPSCDGEVRRFVQQTRATFFCPKCQR